jgi:asparagine synthase (glutamine-hydrolysing)
MCGICGVWGSGGSQAVAAMVTAMHHRGPDDEGIFHDARVAIGMTRLAIIDVSAAGHQPFSNHDQSIWMVYNGEAYNFQSERRLLEAKGYSFSSSSDTEVVLKMYEHYGDDFLLRIRGMFALAIYDRRRGPGRERLLLARDHLGIKPLLYARVSGKLVFASELKALLESGLVEPEIDAEGLRLLLTFGSLYQPQTIIRGVQMLPPAHRMIVENGHEKIERYWSLAARRHAEFANGSYEDLVAAVAKEIEESVALQLVSDVPLGAFLSGGIDSSLLVAMMARKVSHRVKTFSVGFESEGAHLDETSEAERTAEFLGTEHSNVLVTGDELRDRISHVAWSLDQPSVDGVNSYFVSRAARQGVTVSVSGNGGDELFAGYPCFIYMAADERRWAANPFEAAARSMIASVASLRTFDRYVAQRVGGVVTRARGLAGFVSRYGSTSEVFGALGAARVMSRAVKDGARVGSSLDRDLVALDEMSCGTTIQRVSALSVRGYNNNQLLRDTDAVSMAHSLEVRVPFLDPVVADAALSLPDSAKLGHVSWPGTAARSYKESGAKRILFDVGRGILPPDFDSQQKRGFAMPFESWLKGTLRDVLMDTLSESQVRARGILKPREVSTVLSDFERGSINWTRPWLLMMIELWCREVVDRCGAAVRSHGSAGGAHRTQHAGSR